MVNNPRPTHKVNSAWDAHFYNDWDNKFKETLNRSAYVNSSGDAALYENLRHNVTSTPTYNPTSTHDAKIRQMHNNWKSLCPKPSVTSPVKHSEYRNDAKSGWYKASRGYDEYGNIIYHGGIDFYPSDAYVKNGESKSLFGSDGTPRNVYSMADGEVIAYCGAFCGSDDQAIVVKHDGFYALYGEISTNLNVGDTVKQGQNIGMMKLTDIQPNGSLMLHLEILKGDYPYDVFLGGSGRVNYQTDPTYVYNLPDF